MGSSDDDEMAYNDETPSRRVFVDGFKCMKYPVTRRLWQEVMGKQPKYGWWPTGPADNRPVTKVNWFEAIEFCNRLSEKEGLEPCYQLSRYENASKVEVDIEVTWTSRKGYRLLTEAEWEYACRAGTTTRWWFGDDMAKLDESAWHSENARKRLQPVGQKLANPWGIYDMHGNIAEWVWDRYGACDSQDVRNPEGPDTGENRVLRGGSFHFAAGALRFADRYGLLPGIGSWPNGFRCACSS